MIGKLAYSCVETKDITASRRFYTEQLGLKLTAEGEGWFTLDGNGQSIVVWSGDRPTTLMAFLQPELEEAHTAMRARGVQVSDITEHPGGRHFMITDPDGNPIMITND